MKILPIINSRGVPFEIQDAIVGVIIGRLLKEAKEQLIKGEINENIFQEVWEMMLSDLAKHITPEEREANRDVINDFLEVNRLEIRRQVKLYGAKAIMDGFRDDELRKSQLN